MNKTVSAVMIVVGVGLFVFALSDYTPEGSSQVAGWSDTCRYVMTAGAMLVSGGRMLS